MRYSASMITIDLMETHCSDMSICGDELLHVCMVKGLRMVAFWQSKARSVVPWSEIMHEP